MFLTINKQSTEKTTLTTKIFFQTIFIQTLIQQQLITMSEIHSILKDITRHSSQQSSKQLPKFITKKHFERFLRYLLIVKSLPLSNILEILKLPMSLLSQEEINETLPIFQSYEQLQSNEINYQDKYLPMLLTLFQQIQTNQASTSTSSSTTTTSFSQKNNHKIKLQDFLSHPQVQHELTHYSNLPFYLQKTYDELELQPMTWISFVELKIFIEHLSMLLTQSSQSPVTLQPYVKNKEEEIDEQEEESLHEEEEYEEEQDLLTMFNELKHPKTHKITYEQLINHPIVQEEIQSRNIPKHILEQIEETMQLTPTSTMNFDEMKDYFESIGELLEEEQSENLLEEQLYDLFHELKNTKTNKLSLTTFKLHPMIQRLIHDKQLSITQLYHIEKRLFGSLKQYHTTQDYELNFDQIKDFFLQIIK